MHSALLSHLREVSFVQQGCYHLAVASEDPCADDVGLNKKNIKLQATSVISGKNFQVFLIGQYKEESCVLRFHLI